MQPVENNACSSDKRRQEGGYPNQEHRCECAYESERRAKHVLAVVTLLIGKAEKGGFHAKYENHQHQRHIGINVGDCAVAASGCRKFVCVERHQQIVEKASYDAA